MKSSVRRSSVVLPLLLLAFACCGILLGTAASSNSYHWELPKGFPRPYVPADNPMTKAKVELGRYLFYEPRLSVNGTMSCASCHKQELAFTDGRLVGKGATGQLHSRSAMSLVNVAYSGALTWSNPQMKRLEDQALTPMFGDHPVELGLGKGTQFLSFLGTDSFYQTLFKDAYPQESDPYTLENVTKALASFERSMISARSPYDRYHYGGEDTAISESAKRGEILFFDQRLSCFRCHGGFTFSSDTVSERNPDREIEFNSTGLYNVPGTFSYPAPNLGVYEFTKNPADVGKFKAPTLRNIAVTAPYMHDGSIGTLAQVLEHYAAGGRTIETGTHAGVGRNNPNKDPLIRGFVLSAQDREDLVAFLNSLTDEVLLHDPRFADPHKNQVNKETKVPSKSSRP